MSTRKRVQRDRATPTRWDEPEIYKRARTTAFIIAELIGYHVGCERKIYRNWLVQAENRGKKMKKCGNFAPEIAAKIRKNTQNMRENCAYVIKIYETKRLYCVEWTQYSICPKRCAICNRCFPGPTRVLDENGMSIVSAVFTGSHKVTDRLTNRQTYLVVNNRRSAECTVEKPNYVIVYGWKAELA